jgi:hypothetical protein
VVAMAVMNLQQEKWWYLCREIGVIGSCGEPTVHHLPKNMSVNMCLRIGFCLFTRSV